MQPRRFINANANFIGIDGYHLGVLHLKPISHQELSVQGSLTERTNAKALSRKIKSKPVIHDHTGELNRLSRIKGQVEGIERMIIDRRYCPEIVHQIKAARSALKALELSVIEGHMQHCVKAAVISRDNKIIQEKMDEILSLLKGANA